MDVARFEWVVASRRRPSVSRPGQKLLRSSTNHVERPRRMLPHNRTPVFAHRLQHRRIIHRPQVPEHNARVTLQHPQLRALDRA